MNDQTLPITESSSISPDLNSELPHHPQKSRPSLKKTLSLLVLGSSLLVFAAVIAYAIKFNTDPRSRAFSSSVPPIITTDKLPSAQMGVSYKAVIEGRDSGTYGSNPLFIAVSELPNGLSSSCPAVKPTTTTTTPTPLPTVIIKPTSTPTPAPRPTIVSDPYPTTFSTPSATPTFTSAQSTVLGESTTTVAQNYAQPRTSPTSVPTRTPVKFVAISCEIYGAPLAAGEFKIKAVLLNRQTDLSTTKEFPLSITAIPTPVPVSNSCNFKGVIYDTKMAQEIISKSNCPTGIYAPLKACDTNRGEWTFTLQSTPVSGTSTPQPGRCQSVCLVNLVSKTAKADQICSVSAL